MSRDTKILSLKDQEKLDDDIHHVEGVLELILCSLTSENVMDPEPGVLTVIMDAQEKMKEIEKAVDVLTAV